MKSFRYLHWVLCLGLLYILSSCDKDNRTLDKFVVLDLSEKGFPFSIKVPKGAEATLDTTRENVELVEKKLIVKGDRYHIRIERILKEYANPSQNPEIVKDNRLSLERKLSHKGTFDDVELDEKQGFIYTTQLAPKGSLYHFFYCTFQNGQQYEITDYFSVNEQPSENDIELMYASVKQE